MYAIIETGGKQIKVEAGDTIFVEKLDVEAGEKVVFDKVLFVGDKTVKLGAPYVEGATAVSYTHLNYKYQKDNNFIVISGVFLNEEEAKKMGNGISEQGITCVIKQVKFSNELKEEIEQQNYEIIIKELSS